LATVLGIRTLKPRADSHQNVARVIKSAIPTTPNSRRCLPTKQEEYYLAKIAIWCKCSSVLQCNME